MTSRTPRRLRATTLFTIAALALAACEQPGTAPILAPSAGIARATVPAQGSATTLDIATWNIEWFGDAANGPTNEAVQQANVRDVIAGADLDIWGLEEVVSRPAFDTLLARLPGYAGVLANDTSVVNGPQYYSGFSNAEQKVALLFKSAVATVRSARIILTANDYDFAGRPPMEVQLTTTLNGVTQDLVVIVMHMKAGTDATSLQRRKNAGIALKDYLDTTWPTQKVIVLGDWNDDVDTSIAAGNPTPYQNFVSDSARYRFPLKVLSDAGETSEVNYAGSLIDQHLVTNELLATYVAGSGTVFHPEQYIASYGTSTSDHYPTITRWNVSGSGPANAAPTASFTNACTDLSCTFTDASTDADGTVTAWSWSFGDGTSATTASPAHSYAAGGSYTVTLTVTDNAGATGTTSRTITVSAPASGITLTTRGYKTRGITKVDLTWSGATGTTADVYRNGAKIATPSNTGSYTDSLGKVSGTYTYKVCNTGTTTCSPSSSVTF